MEKYVFRKYTSNYRKFFKSEKGKLRKLFPSAAIEHVGSTAVPGIGGKGIIDILLAVRKSKIKSASKRLQNAGYELRKTAGTRHRLFFRKDYKFGAGFRRVHIHLTFLGSVDNREMIGFRNYLISHNDVTKEYEKLKKKGVKLAVGRGDVYKKFKEKFIKDITRKALKQAK